MNKVVLSRRELIALLVHNGFTELPPRSGTSHRRYRGIVDGQTRFVDVDDSIDEFSPKSHGVLFYIVSSQLRLMDSARNANTAWERFYAGEPSIARKAQVAYRKWT